MKKLLFVILLFPTLLFSQENRKKGGVKYEKAYAIYKAETNDKLAYEYIIDAIKSEKEYWKMPAYYHGLAANLLYFLNDFSKCIEEADRAINFKIDLGSAYIIKARCYFDLKNYQKAIEVYNTGIYNCGKNNKDYFELIEMRGRAKSINYDYRGSIRDFTEIIKNDKVILANDLSGIHLLRCSAFYQIGEEIKARMDLNYALKLNPNNKDAKKMLSLMNIADMAGLLNSIMNSGSGSNKSSFQSDRQPLDWDKYGNPIYGPSLREGGYDSNGKKME